MAALPGNVESVKLLLAAPGIDVNIADSYGRTPLYWAERSLSASRNWDSSFKPRLEECARLIRAAGGRK
jgi:hypothetical protein